MPVGWITRLAPPPPQLCCLSPGRVGRRAGLAPSLSGRTSDGGPLPEPLRLPSVRAVASNGGVALFGGGHFLCRRPHRVRHPSSTAWVTTVATREKTETLELRRLVVVVVVVVRTRCNDACLSMTTHEVHLIMGAVSLWTRPPALHLCAGP